MIVLENDIIKVALQELGGTIESIWNKKNKSEHYWQYDRQIWPRRTSVCFPICGGLIDNEYFYDSKKYSLPMHGFLREHYGKVIFSTRERVRFLFRDSEQTRMIYPFSFEVLLTHSIFENSLLIEYLVKNTGKRDMLFSIGSHYTFNLPNKQSECSYSFSKEQNAKSFTQQNGIIGVQESTSFFDGKRLNMNHLFDISSKIYKVDDLDTDFIAIESNDRLYTKVSFNGFEYVVLWAPKGNNSPFACIEPWAGMADFQGHNKQFVQKKGIISLKPFEERVFFQKISVY